MDLSYYKVHGTRKALFTAAMGGEVSVKDTCVTVRVAEGVNLAMTSIADTEVRYPEYRSWAGFNGWKAQITEDLGLTSDQAHLALLNPKKPFEWVMRLPDWVAPALAQRVTPFNSVTINPSAVQYWLDNGDDYLCSLEQMLHYGHVLLAARPRSKEEFLLCRYMQCGNCCPSEDVLRRMRMWRDFKGPERSPLELLIFATLGRVSPKMVEIFKLVIGDLSRKAILEQDWRDSTAMQIADRFSNTIDPRYFTGETTLAALHAAGVPAGKLVPKELSKREAGRFIAERGNTTYFGDRAAVRWLAESLLPSGWAAEARNVPSVRWAARHVKQLSKTRLLHGPGGAVSTLHYHTLLRRVTPQMLVNGEKTAFRIVIAEIEQAAMTEMKASMGENVPLPTLKHKEVAGCTPITTSDALAEEGNGMGHCVGSYVKACLQKVSFIYHLGTKAPGGATLEVCLRADGTYVRQQLFGAHDQPAPAQEPLAKRLISRINRDK